MKNEIIRFFEKYKKQIGIIALILFAIGVFTKSQGVETPLTTGSIISYSGASFGFGVLLLLLSFLALFTGQVYVVLALFIGGIAFVSVSQLIKIFELITQPIVAIVIGLLFIFLIFRKKKSNIHI